MEFFEHEEDDTFQICKTLNSTMADTMVSVLAVLGDGLTGASIDKDCRCKFGGVADYSCWLLSFQSPT